MNFGTLFLALLATSSRFALAQTTTVLTNDPRIIYSGPGGSTLTEAVAYVIGTFLLLGLSLTTRDISVSDVVGVIQVCESQPAT
ncbi:hypothetical protein FRB94_000493 [Tulasnella sp. JGI-2019a]|nr:hypothetical protein FRB94_000493 [Tulasnella sp. JGI-2019a]KAG9039035.1 hypothetical protein FRB95_012746 [Tulasnella sp. JGI-2019a]